MAFSSAAAGHANLEGETGALQQSERDSFITALSLLSTGFSTSQAIGAEAQLYEPGYCPLTSVA